MTDLKTVHLVLVTALVTALVVGGASGLFKDDVAVAPVLDTLLSNTPIPGNPDHETHMVDLDNGEQCIIVVQTARKSRFRIGDYNARVRCSYGVRDG